MYRQIAATKYIILGTYKINYMYTCVHIHIQNPANSDNSDFSDQISDFSDSPSIPIFPVVPILQELSENRSYWRIGIIGNLIWKIGICKILDNGLCPTLVWAYRVFFLKWQFYPKKWILSTGQAWNNFIQIENLNFIPLSQPKLNFILLSGKSAVGQLLAMANKTPTTKEKIILFVAIKKDRYQKALEAGFSMKYLQTKSIKTILRNYGSLWKRGCFPIIPPPPQ